MHLRRACSLSTVAHELSGLGKDEQAVAMHGSNRLDAGREEARHAVLQREACAAQRPYIQRTWPRALHADSHRCARQIPPTQVTATRRDGRTSSPATWLCWLDASVRATAMASCTFLAPSRSLAWMAAAELSGNGATQARTFAQRGEVKIREVQQRAGTGGDNKVVEPW